MDGEEFTSDDVLMSANAILQTHYKSVVYGNQ